MYIEGGRGEQISCGEAECIWRVDFLNGGWRLDGPSKFLARVVAEVVGWCFGNPELPTGVGGARCWVGVGWGAKARFPAGERGLHLGSMFPGGAIFVYRLMAVL